MCPLPQLLDCHIDKALRPVEDWSITYCCVAVNWVGNGYKLFPLGVKINNGDI